MSSKSDIQLALWVRYIHDSEEYDRTLPHVKDEDGAAVVHPKSRKFSMIQARRNYDEMRKDAKRLGVLDGIDRNRSKVDTARAYELYNWAEEVLSEVRRVQVRDKGFTQVGGTA